jgi:hypothetical protein
MYDHILTIILTMFAMFSDVERYLEDVSNDTGAGI